MRLTESQLRKKIRQIIAETRVLKESFGTATYYVNRDGVMYMGDEKGNEEEILKDPDYFGLSDGEMMEIEDMNRPYSRYEEMSY
jgi:hypothetical protein